MTEYTHKIKYITIAKYLRFYDRFQERTNKDGSIPEHCPELGNCWIWKGAKNGQYGLITLNKKSILAHRQSYLFNIGEIPEGILVCHKCDNPGCVRPDHLFLGTNTDNIRDASKKGRMKRGESNHRSNLTEEHVRIIKIFPTYQDKINLSLRQFSYLIRVDPASVSKIIKGKIWKHVDVSGYLIEANLLDSLLKIRNRKIKNAQK